MIGKEYQNHKKNVIDLFKGYKKSRGDFDDGVDLKHLQSRVDALVNGKFILSVAGEVKAGKSTFINALLGAEILPSDVLQASSAVVEIFKHESSVLKVKFASGKEETLLNDLNTPDIDEAKDRLHEICRLHDDYRDIPTTLIDACIVHSDDLPNVDGEFIAQLEKNSSENLKNKQAKIASYVSTRTKDKIPVEISFGYPLKWDFDELRIVDTPGVNATGGVQETAHKYFEAANAILFVHPIKPIESRSFRKFVESVISNRSKETLFLILTHAGLYPGDEIVRLQAEAGRLYEGLIPENRILVVDSLLKLIHCDLDKGVSVGEIRKSENKKKILSSYREQAEDEDRNLIDVVLEASRFENMLSTIDEFSMKAPSIQLQEILEKIKSGYEKQEELINENIKNLEIQKKDPQKFEQELDRIQKALEKYKLLTRATQEDLNSNYSGRHSSWQQDIDILKVKYPELITGSDSVESVRKHTVDAMNAIQSKVDDFSKELTNRLENALIKAGKSFNKEHQISIPKVDLAALEEKANKLAYKEIDKNEIHLERRWYTLWLKKHETVRCVGKEKVFDNEKFLSEYKTECNKKFYDIVNDLPNKSKIVLELYLDNFRKEMDSIIESRQNALDKEKSKKRSNNEIIEDIKALSKKKEHIHPELKRCNEILGDMHC